MINGRESDEEVVHSISVRLGRNRFYTRNTATVSVVRLQAMNIKNKNIRNVKSIHRLCKLIVSALCKNDLFFIFIF